MQKVYLGDSVYVEFGGYGLTLTTENGYGPSNTIFLEPIVYRHLKEFVERLEADAKARTVEATPWRGKAREWWLCGDPSPGYLTDSGRKMGCMITHPSNSNSCGNAILVREVLRPRPARKKKRK